MEHLVKSNKTKYACKGLKRVSVFVSKKAMPEPDDINMYVNYLNVFYTRFDDNNLHTECNEILKKLSAGIVRKE